MAALHSGAQARTASALRFGPRSAVIDVSADGGEAAQLRAPGGRDAGGVEIQRAVGGVGRAMDHLARDRGRADPGVDVLGLVPAPVAPPGELAVAPVLAALMH